MFTHAYGNPIAHYVTGQEYIGRVVSNYVDPQGFPKTAAYRL